LPKVLAETEDFLSLKKCAARRAGFGGSGLWMLIPVLLFGCGYSFVYAALRPSGMRSLRERGRASFAPSSRLGLNTHSLGFFGNYFWQKV
jgi:hypothetical protein